MTRRARTGLQRSALTVAGQLVAALVGIALLWGAVVIGLLLAGVDSHTVQSLTGYRSVHSGLSGVRTEDVRDGWVRLGVGLGGLAAAILLLVMARAQLPRPSPPRGRVQLTEAPRGDTTVAPRAIERAAEGAAVSHPAVRSAVGRYADRDLSLDVTLGGPGDVAETLRAVRAGARESLERHGLPMSPVHVTLVKLDPTRTRELA